MNVYNENLIKHNTKPTTRFLLINWGSYSYECINVVGSAFITGGTGSGKTTFMDAWYYLRTGSTSFNECSGEKGRSLVSYLKGDLKASVGTRYLRGDCDVVSYIAEEIFSPDEKNYFVVIVCLELPKNHTSVSSSWCVVKNARIEDINFIGDDDTVTVKSNLTVKGVKLSAKEFMGKEKGLAQSLLAMGIRCEPALYRKKIAKLKSFKDNKDGTLDKCIHDCVLEEHKITSLDSLREHRSNYNVLIDTYNSLELSKKKLEEIESQTAVYERKCDEFNKRKLMYSYQEWQKVKDEIQTINNNCDFENVRLKNFNDKLYTEKKNLTAARERLRNVENDDTYQGIENIIKARESELKRIEENIRIVEEDYKKILKLSNCISSIKEVVSEYGLELSNYPSILNLIEANVDTGEKQKDFISVGNQVKNIQNEIRQQQYDINRQNGELKTEISDLENKKKILEGNQFVFDKAFMDAKSFIQKELRQKNIDTDVRFFCEFITEITDSKWHKAIETFLGNKRFDIIVDGKYCKNVMQIVNDNPSLKCKVVLTDKLPDTPVKPDSAASLLVIKNPFARKYANYLLNGIHLCNSIDELHDYPLGGLMINGMLAKGYAINKMFITKTSLFIGQDAIKNQLEDVKREIEEKQNIVSSLNTSLDKIRRNLSMLDIDWNVDNYSFSAPSDMFRMKNDKAGILVEIKKYKSDPGFMAVLEERESAKNEVLRIESCLENIQKQIGSSEQYIHTLTEQAKTLKDDEKEKKDEYENDVKSIPSFSMSIPEEYAALVRKQNTMSVITKKTVDEWGKQQEDTASSLTKLHCEYCKLNGSDFTFTGVAFIQRYREEYRNLSAVKIEDAKAKLEEQYSRLQNAFVSDFVAELDAKIIEVKSDIDKTNRLLKQMPFGPDTYSFKMEERPDRRLFFNICRRMHENMDSPELYFNSIKDDEEAELELKDFLDIILEEENEKEYTDYRNYFTYDLVITRSDMVFNGSEKISSSSTGEVRNPFYVILIAGVMQCFPPSKCCSRIVFIDEAFDTLDGDRLDQLIAYLNSNGIQSVIAAPNTKIKDIATKMPTVLTAKKTGNYTNIVDITSKMTGF